MTGPQCAAGLMPLHRTYEDTCPVLFVDGVHEKRGVSAGNFQSAPLQRHFLNNVLCRYAADIHFGLPHSLYSA